VPLAPVAQDTQAYRAPTRQECYANAGTTLSCHRAIWPVSSSVRTVA